MRRRPRRCGGLFSSVGITWPETYVPSVERGDLTPSAPKCPVLGYCLNRAATGDDVHTITDLSLVTGPVPPVVTVLGILALLWLIFSRSRRHVLISIPVCIVAAIAITLVLYWLIEKVWRPFPDPIAVRSTCGSGWAFSACCWVFRGYLRRRGSTVACSPWSPCSWWSCRARLT